MIGFLVVLLCLFLYSGGTVASVTYWKKFFHRKATFCTPRDCDGWGCSTAAFLLSILWPVAPFVFAVLKIASLFIGGFYKYMIRIGDKLSEIGSHDA